MIDFYLLSASGPATFRWRAFHESAPPAGHVGYRLAFAASTALALAALLIAVIALRPRPQAATEVQSGQSLASSLM
jgi:hypothetical protein